VWLLLVMLGAVLLLMRQLEQPATVEFLGRVFSSDARQAAVVPTEAGSGEAKPADRDLDEQAEAPHVEDAVEDAAIWGEDPWAAVRDNALLSRPAEQKAWSLLLERAQQTSPDELRRQSLGEVAYAQLVNQPDAYRGRAVRVRGSVLRESRKRASVEAAGVAGYHQLVIAPRGGGEWPIVVYVLELPEEFPKGDGLREDVTVDGFFFKNWSYPHADGMGLAPVIVARTVDWPSPRPSSRPAERSVDLNAIVFGAGLAAAAATFFVGWVVRQTRRPAAAGAPLPDLLSLETES